MEKLPYPEHPGIGAVPPTDTPAEPGTHAKNDWRNGLPELAGSLVTLRELRASDARSLFLSLSSDEVTRFLSPPPATVDGFERFIAWSQRQREAGQFVAFAVVPRGSAVAVGLFQMRSLEPAFGTAEWGFAIAPEFWGTGMFGDGARMVLAFAFETLGVRRLEARGALANGRGNAAIRKLGATREGILRKSFLRHGEQHDEAMWTMLADDWREAQRGSGSRHIH